MGDRTEKKSASVMQRVLMKMGPERLAEMSRVERRTPPRCSHEVLGKIQVID